MVSSDVFFAPDRKPAGITIREFRISDLPRVLEIERRAFPDAWDESWFLYFFQVNPSGFMVAVQDKEVIVGYAIVDVEGGERESRFPFEAKRVPPHKGHLLNIAVDGRWRRRGIATALVEAVIKYVLERGGDELSLEVRTSNAAAKRLYSSMGFEETGRILRNYYPDGGDALVMRRKLAKKR